MLRVLYEPLMSLLKVLDYNISLFKTMLNLYLKKKREHFLLPFTQEQYGVIDSLYCPLGGGRSCRWT